MTPREIAIALTECENDEFLEVFALFYQDVYGKGIPEECNVVELVKDMDVRLLCCDLSQVLNNIKDDMIL